LETSFAAAFGFSSLDVSGTTLDASFEGAAIGTTTFSVSSTGLGASFTASGCFLPDGFVTSILPTVLNANFSALAFKTTSSFFSSSAYLSEPISTLFSVFKLVFSSSS